MSAALVVFAKPPVPGQVKTRLTSLLTPEEAARLYTAFVHDALRQYVGLGVPVRLYLTDPAGALPPGLLPAGVEVFGQQGRGLGARMQHALLETIAAGAHGGVIVGTDHPTLPTAFIERALEALDTPGTLCIGPSADGGYYLIGMNEFYPEVFQDIAYSRPDVFDKTLEQAATTAAEVVVLPRWYDVDTPVDLARLAADLDAAPQLAPRTHEVLRHLPDPRSRG